MRLSIDFEGGTSLQMLSNGTDSNGYNLFVPENGKTSERCRQRCYTEAIFRYVFLISVYADLDVVVTDQQPAGAKRWNLWPCGPDILLLGIQPGEADLDLLVD
jgi:hypothetical protein